MLYAASVVLAMMASLGPTERTFAVAARPEVALKANDSFRMAANAEGEKANEPEGAKQPAPEVAYHDDNSLRSERTRYWPDRPYFDHPPSAPAKRIAEVIHDRDSLYRIPKDTKHLELEVWFTNEELVQQLAKLTALESFTNSSSVKISIELAQVLSKAKHLRELRFLSYVNDDPGIGELANCKGLEVFFAQAETRAIPSFVAAASHWPKLNSFGIYAFGSGGGGGNSIGITSFAGIGKLKQLKFLQIKGCDINASDMAEIDALPLLENIDFSHTEFESPGETNAFSRVAHRATSIIMPYGDLPKDFKFDAATAMDAEGKEIPTASRLTTLDLTFVGQESVGLNDGMLASLHYLTSLTDLTTRIYIYPDNLGTPPRYLGSATVEGMAALGKIKSLKRLNVAGMPINAEVLGIWSKSLVNLEHLSLARCVIESPEAAIELLAEFPVLASIDLTRTALSQEHIKAIVENPKLTSVSFSRCSGFDDESCKILSQSTTISSIDVSYTKITTKGLSHLAEIKSLAHLNLSGCEQCKIASWPSTKSLKSLWLDGSAAVDSGMPTKSKAPKLDILSIAGPMSKSITSGAMASIGTLTNLRFLDLSSVPVTNAGLLQLSGLAKLEWLVVDANTLCSNGTPIAKPLGSKGWAKLQRIDIFVRETPDQPRPVGVPPVNGPLYTSLRGRFTDAQVHFVPVQ